MLIGIITLGVLIVGCIFFVIHSKRKTGFDAVPQYICSHCGEKHCDCHKQQVS